MRKGFIKGFARGLSVDPRSTNSLNSLARRTLCQLLGCYLSLTVRNALLFKRRTRTI